MRPDDQIKKDILDELDWDPEINASRVGVIVKDGAVTLSGHVATFLQRIAAEEAVKRVADVRAVVNDIEVKLPSEHRMSDQGLAERIAHVLEWNVSSAGRDITADVKDGAIILSGELEWGYEKTNVLRNIQHVGGVAEIIDHITIKPRISVADVQHRIKSALQRHAHVDADKINVTASGGTVRLTGKVKSLAERDLATDAAWSAAGVAQVVDQLTVG